MVPLLPKKLIAVGSQYILAYKTYASIHSNMFSI